MGGEGSGREKGSGRFIGKVSNKVRYGTNNKKKEYTGFYVCNSCSLGLNGNALRGSRNCPNCKRGEMIKVSSLERK